MKKEKVFMLLVFVVFTVFLVFLFAQDRMLPVGSTELTTDGGFIIPQGHWKVEILGFGGGGGGGGGGSSTGGIAGSGGSGGGGACCQVYPKEFVLSPLTSSTLIRVRIGRGGDGGIGQGMRYKGDNGQSGGDTIVSIAMSNQPPFELIFNGGQGGNGGGAGAGGGGDRARRTDCPNYSSGRGGSSSFSLGPGPFPPASNNRQAGNGEGSNFKQGGSGGFYQNNAVGNGDSGSGGGGGACYGRGGDGGRYCSYGLPNVWPNDKPEMECNGRNGELGGGGGGGAGGGGNSIAGGRGGRGGDGIVIITLKRLDPLSPTSLTAVSETSRRVKLTWNDNSDNEDGFRISRRRENSQFSLIATLAKDSNQYIDSTVQPNTVYVYSIQAFNSTSPSDPVEISIRTLVAPPIPARPNIRHLTATSSTEIKIEWEYPIHLVIDGFVIERSLDGRRFSELRKIEDSRQRSLYDKGLNPNTLYYYRIRAINESGESFNSNRRSIKTQK